MSQVQNHRQPSHAFSTSAGVRLELQVDGAEVSLVSGSRGEATMNEVEADVDVGRDKRWPRLTKVVFVIDS